MLFVSEKYGNPELVVNTAHFDLRYFLLKDPICPESLNHKN
jgi:hypothetical protein